MKKLLLIDTFNFLHRAYHALPKTFKDINGEPTNAVYGVTAMLINILDTLKPNYAVAALDGEKPTFRVEDFTAYKAHRKPMDPDLASQIPKVFEILDAFGIKKMLVEGYEADDVIGTAAIKFANATTQVLIVSNDHDLWQLITKNVFVMSPNTKGQVDWIGEKEVVSRMGFNPKQMVDYKSLRGDLSDNIPGVFGIGEKTAQTLIATYGTLENIYRSIEKITPNSLREKLLNNSEQAYMSQKLATIITDVPMHLELQGCKYSDFNKGRVVELLKKYNFKSLTKRLGFDVDSGKSKKEASVNENQLGLF